MVRHDRQLGIGSDGLRQHVRNAIGYGATREEVMEVYEIAATLGVHSCTLGVPILLEETNGAARG